MAQLDQSKLRVTQIIGLDDLCSHVQVMITVTSMITSLVM